MLGKRAHDRTGNASSSAMLGWLDAQGIVAAFAAADCLGHERDIVRYVFRHSRVLARLQGGLTMLQAYV